MTTVTVFRETPPPVIGVCGAVFDRRFEAFEQSLDWLEAIGVLVERIDPHERPQEAARFEAVADSLAHEGNGCLPLILVDGILVSSKIRPTRAQLARIVGQTRSQADLLVAR